MSPGVIDKLPIIPNERRDTISPSTEHLDIGRGLWLCVGARGFED